MSSRSWWLLLAALTLTCCASAGTARPPEAVHAPPAPREADTQVLAAQPEPVVAVPLVLDRTDVALGTTVHFGRVPTPAELHDLEYTYGLARVVISLETWPSSFAELEGLNRRPVDLETLVILSGWPPSREAAEAWNFVTGRVRLIVLVGGPPADRGTITDLNAMRSLERVVAQMDQPSRTGFERLQRPLSFRKVVR